MTAWTNAVYPLDHLGVIEVSGDDAASFLQGQLTQDALSLGSDAARLGAYCSPKGRILVSFLMLRPRPDLFLLVCPADAVAATVKRLGMFVLRAKARLRDVSAQWRLQGRLSDVPLTDLQGTGAATASAPSWNSLTCAYGPQGLLAVTLPGVDGVWRQVTLEPVQADTGLDAPAATSPATSPAITPATAATASGWAWLEVRSGVSLVGAAMADQWVPQMLNYESVGAVNFKKGCYPGQEVVARSQFRGTLKRRALRIHADTPLSVGQELYAGAAPSGGEPVGTVVQAAAHPEGGRWAAVACVQVQTVQAATELHTAGQAAGVVQTDGLPYPLLDDI